jgi:hypothetical protein
LARYNDTRYVNNGADVLSPRGAAIARHKRAGRIEERDGKLDAQQHALGIDIADLERDNL